MFESDKMGARVRPIKFKSIDEDNDQRHRPAALQDCHKSVAMAAEQIEPSRSERVNMSTSIDHHHHHHQHDSKRLDRRAPNFSLEFAYPAVILDDVCFSVDKSQQQSNFLNECLFRLRSCLAPICAGENQDSSDGPRVQILKSVRLSVPHGTIFGLLGPSSCGKTTLLRCLVGLLEPDSGSIRLFGSNSFSRPAAASGHAKANKFKLCPCLCCAGGGPSSSRSNDCKVPGSNVGYMPQDLGLYEDFTIAQLLTMFGNYMRMDTKLISERIKFMADFLELPDVNRQIQTLSGGQKRRVSFAIACLHMPPLIILDEPTVGVDPILRRSIWKYLRRLASEENKTIIITTHYIEEAAQADQVALMRAGEILVQDSPSKIIKANNSKTLEEAFLKICNSAQGAGRPSGEHNKPGDAPKLKMIAQPRFQWPMELEQDAAGDRLRQQRQQLAEEAQPSSIRPQGCNEHDAVIRELKLRAQEKLAIYDQLRCNRIERAHQQRSSESAGQLGGLGRASHASDNNFCSMLDADQRPRIRQPRMMQQILEVTNFGQPDDEGVTTNGSRLAGGKRKKNRRLGLFKRNKFVLNEGLRGAATDNNNAKPPYEFQTSCSQRNKMGHSSLDDQNGGGGDDWRQRISKSVTLFWALLYKNYRRNVNSMPLLAFQFLLPMIQMISFSLCVGGRPTNIGLGVVNHDRPISFLVGTGTNLTNTTEIGSLDTSLVDDSSSSFDQGDLLSSKLLSFIDGSMLNMIFYNDLGEALADVRRTKLWAALEIGENFTDSITKRFDPDNFYQLDLGTIHQSVIKLYPDRSNKILDMICHRSLVDSFRHFLASEFEHLKRLPIETARPIFDIKPNVISNSIDGYTESIAPGLLASLTYIMAAGLTTFIMVVERSAGILERTYTSGINPISYLLAHAIFRSAVMMMQIAFVLILTFYVLQQPLVGSIWLAYAMLMVLNVTGICYGLLISSIVTDQNGAALTIVSSLVVKITLSGILWPFEAIPYWLRTICYIQPLTMPVQALKAITLKGATLGDRPVNLGFLVSISWLIVFLVISTKRFKFYQH
jgi:ABC-type multidrug transport system ATPase subunit/ABC-type multidrug transport system permease subunit